MNLSLLPRSALLLVAVLTPLGAAAQSVPNQVDAQRSSVTIHVFKAGLLSAFGHNHEIRGPVSGTVNESARAVELVVESRQLVVLDPDLAPDKRTEVQQRMLGPDVLDSKQFPQIRFRLTSAQAEGPERWIVRGDCTIRGQTRPLRAEVSAGGGRYRGSFALKQRDFGINPVSVGGGTVKVKDEIKIDFEILVQR